MVTYTEPSSICAACCNTVCVNALVEINMLDYVAVRSVNGVYCVCNRSVGDHVTALGPDFQKILGKILSLA